MFPNSFKIANKKIGIGEPTYFIADIAANHDGDIERAKDLIYKAAEAGADAAKFQHFQAETIVSNNGFLNLGNQLSHQKNWKKSVPKYYSRQNWKISGPNALSKCPESRELVSGHFWGTHFLTFFGIWKSEISICFRTH